MNYIYRINGETRFPTDEERKKLFRQFVQGLGYRPRPEKGVKIAEKYQEERKREVEKK